jgi:hypothetical protein
MTMVMSVLPLLLIGAGLWWIARHARERLQGEFEDRDSLPAPGPRMQRLARTPCPKPRWAWPALAETTGAWAVEGTMKKIAVLGSGAVGTVLADGFLQHGYEVMRGTREPAKLAEWKTRRGARRRWAPSPMPRATARPSCSR